MSRRVLVTGATGVIGRATVPRLVNAGWSVSGVARARVAAAWLESLGARPVAVDLFDSIAVTDAVGDHGAVVHLATSIPPLHRMGRRRAWATNDRLRVDATRNLIAGARRHGMDRFVKESITFPYADGGDAWLAEDAPLDPAVAWRATLEGERLVRDFGDDGGAGVVLRFGLLYAADARSTDEYRTLARLRLAPVPGRPGAHVSSIHGDDSARGLAASQRIANARFRAATGWAPRWPDARTGWEAIGTSAAARTSG